MVKKGSDLFRELMEIVKEDFEQGGMLDHYRNEADPEARRVFLGLDKEGEEEDGKPRP